MTSDKKWRECVTHHYACDCREEIFREANAKIERLENEIALKEATINEQKEKFVFTARRCGDFERENQSQKQIIEKLKKEIGILRQYGNKDCTAMADEALKESINER